MTVSSVLQRTAGYASAPLCRNCGHALADTFADLGMSPLANSYVKPSQLRQMEPFYPLHAYVCAACLLVQVEEIEAAARIFSDYAYFSSYSSSWLEHAQSYVQMITRRFRIGPASQVIEIASNDGYLLQYFVQACVPVLGIEPAANVAAVANEKGVPTRTLFFNSDTARKLVEEGITADLLIANNVLAHVPDLHSFVAGMKLLLKPQGVITVEFPHLLRMILQNQFDTIYHEHFCYFSFLVIQSIFAQHDLVIFDVDELDTHGGSLRIFAAHRDDASKKRSGQIHFLENLEREAGIDRLETYHKFASRIQQAKAEVLVFFLNAWRTGAAIAGYGAPAKGNTLLNYCGVDASMLPYTVDLSPHKQGLYLPGTRIPICSPEKIRETRPDYLFVLPWNLKEEIAEQMQYIREWGGRFVVAIPSIDVF